MVSFVWRFGFVVVSASLISFVLLSCAVYLIGFAIGIDCPGVRNLTPATFSDDPQWRMADYEVVRYPAREPHAHFELEAFYIPATTESARTVIFSHGLAGCKHDPRLLRVASLLQRNGYNVLLPDLPRHGNATPNGTHMYGGIVEGYALLGGYDWLLRSGRAVPGMVAIGGQSLGAASATVAWGAQPDLVALWSDSGYRSIFGATNDTLRVLNLGWLTGPGIYAGSLLSRADLSADPAGIIRADAAGRPVYLLHSTSDAVVHVRNVYALQEAAEDAAVLAGLWVFDNVAHVDAVFAFPEEYERRLIAFYDASFAARIR